MKAYVQAWTEFERGYGQRFDGHSIHRTREAFQEYINKLFAEERLRNGNRVPDCYSRPEGKLYEVEVSDAQLQEFLPPGKDSAWLHPSIYLEPVYRLVDRRG